MIWRPETINDLILAAFEWNFTSLCRLPLYSNNFKASFSQICSVLIAYPSGFYITSHELFIANDMISFDRKWVRRRRGFLFSFLFCLKVFAVVLTFASQAGGQRIETVGHIDKEQVRIFLPENLGFSRGTSFFQRKMVIRLFSHVNGLTSRLLHFTDHPFERFPRNSAW